MSYAMLLAAGGFLLGGLVCGGLARAQERKDVAGGGGGGRFARLDEEAAGVPARGKVADAAVALFSAPGGVAPLGSHRGPPAAFFTPLVASADPSDPLRGIAVAALSCVSLLKWLPQHVTHNSAVALRKRLRRTLRTSSGTSRSIFTTAGPTCSI